MIGAIRGWGISMVFGMAPLLALHTLISVACILSGIVVVWGILNNRTLPAWTAVFIVTALVDDISGFPLPPFGLDPPRILGIISLIVLVPQIAARYLRGMNGIWRGIYAGTSVATLYFNIFVLIAQTFAKVPAAHALAPTGTEPPFAIAQGIALVLFLAIGWVAVRRFRPGLKFAGATA